MSRRDSIRKKYSLERFVGKLSNELQLQDGTNFIKQISHEELDVLTVGNLNTYTRNIEDEGVLEYMKNLKSDFIKTEERYVI